MTSNGFVWSFRGKFSKYTATRSRCNLTWIRRVYDKFILAKKRSQIYRYPNHVPWKSYEVSVLSLDPLKFVCLPFCSFIYSFPFLSFFFTCIHNNRKTTVSFICMTVTIPHCKSVESMIISGPRYFNRSWLHQSTIHWDVHVEIDLKWMSMHGGGPTLALSESCRQSL